jgi:proteasome accessory factor C
VTIRRGPRPVNERLRRLLIMLPWLMERGETPVAEVLERFGITERDLVKDLELVAMCGLPPYVDEMVDVFIDEGVVFTGVPRLFTAQPRLTAPEGLALLLSGRSALQLPGADADGALARALDKVHSALRATGLDVGDSESVVIDSAAPDFLAEVTSAARTKTVLSIDYRRAAADDVTERVVVPQTVFADQGHWYLVADDRRSGAERTFRVDRIERCEPTGDIGEPRDVMLPTDRGWFAGRGLPTVTIDLDASVAWVVERFPTEQIVDRGNGAVRAVLPVASVEWLETLLLRLGAAAHVVEPEEWRSAGTRAARRLLELYE